MKTTKKLMTIGIMILILLAISPFSNALPNKKILKSRDEGSHFDRILPVREWWYYNVIFDKSDSELRNWSAMISFHHMYKTFVEPDILFVTLYDDENTTYGGMVNRDSGTLKAEKHGVNLIYEDSWVNGEYPSWHVYVEDEDADQEHEIILDLEFEAQCDPYWVMINTGRGLLRNPFGYYSINHCDVKGQIKIDGVIYKVHGTGYHDHTWALYLMGGASLFWDWFSIHFDNGLHAFIWQLTTKPRNDIFKPHKFGFSWITDGKEFTEFNLFTMNYVDFESTSIPDYMRPKLFHLSSHNSNIKIDLYLETDNMHEYLWDEKTTVDIGLWEGSCRANGTISIGPLVAEVEGFAISEIFRVF